MQSSKQARECIKFGLFEVDLRAGEIRKRTRKLPLQDKPFRILSALLRNPGTVVSRDELRREVWPEDTFVDFDNGLNTAINKIREALDDSAENPRFIETLSRRGYRFIAPVEMLATAIRSIAVLPFASYSKDAADYFAEGMTETLISHLCRIKPLKVISRTSAMRYKDTDLGVPEIARELKVDAVVEGSVQRSRSSVLITAQLIEASSDEHLWAESYQRPLEDILALQSEIAQAIARQISDIVAPPETGSGAGKLQVDPRVYQDYLQGRYFLNRRAPMTVEKAITCFEKVIEADPVFAPAHSSLAESLMWRIIYADAFPANGYAAAKLHAERALRLDPSLAAAHVTLGLIHRVCDWRLDEAAAEFERALKVEPGNVDAHQLYGIHLALMGQHQAAEMQLQQALSLDPFSLSAHTDLGWIHYFARRYQPAIDQLLRALEMDDYPIARYRLGFAYEQLGMIDEAMKQFETLVQAFGDKLRPQAWLAREYGLIGRTREAEEVAHKLILRHDETGFPGSVIALLLLGLGKHQDAIRWLFKAREECDPNLITLLVDPICDCVRSNADFKKLFKQTGLRRW